MGRERLRPGTCPADARGSGGAQKMSNAASNVAMSSFLLTNTARRAFRKSTWFLSSTWFSARVASVSRRGPASSPASWRRRAKAPSRGNRSGEEPDRSPPHSAGRPREARVGSGSGTSRLLDHRGNLLADLLEIFLILECGAEGRIHQGRVDARRAKRCERARPVQRLRDSGHLVEVHPSKPLDQRRHLTGQSGGSFGRACPHDLDLLLEVGVVDPVIEATALEGVVDLARPVGCDDHERRLLRLDGANLGDRDLEVRQQLQQERLELLVRAVDLVDEQDRRRGIVVVDGIQQRAPQEELGTEDLALRRAYVVRLAQKADVEQLARIVPLIDRVRQVDALVALEADEAGTQHVGHDLGRLGLADTGLAFDEQRFLELQRKEDRGRKASVTDVATLAQARLDVFDRGGYGSHRRKDYRP